MPSYTIDELRELYGSNTKVLFCVTENVAHDEARMRLELERDLDEFELDSVSKLLEYGMSVALSSCLRSAVKESVRVAGKADDPDFMKFLVTEMDQNGNTIEEKTMDINELIFIIGDETLINCSEMSLGEEISLESSSDYRVKRVL